MGRRWFIAMGTAMGLNALATAGLAWKVLQAPSADSAPMPSSAYTMEEGALDAAAFESRLGELEARMREDLTARPVASDQALEIARDAAAQAASAEAKAEQAEADIRNLCIIHSICM